MFVASIEKTQWQEEGNKSGWCLYVNFVFLVLVKSITKQKEKIFKKMKKYFIKKKKKRFLRMKMKMKMEKNKQKRWRWRRR